MRINIQIISKKIIKYGDKSAMYVRVTLYLGYLIVL
jgi:hypothetical protein